MKIREDAYCYYFYFLQERMNIFWNRYEGKLCPFSSDKIFMHNKFTNVYRAQDRVSQYLIKEVIYKKDNYSDIDVLLRILIFKIFNSINTWKFLDGKVNIDTKSFNVDTMTELLADRIQNTPIFNAAYMMTGSHRKYKLYKSKHEKWLRMVNQEMIKEGRLMKILKAKSLKEIYDVLLSASFIGSFLAYQYAIDFNYCDFINFNENSFVKAGIGSIRGIKKCFPTTTDYEYCIKYTHENLDKYQERYGFTHFKNLFGRTPTLIDLQNCFCETDKYLRVKMPELLIGNVRIKQKFVLPKETINYFFPPKWQINQFIQTCTTQNSKESTLF